MNCWQPIHQFQYKYVAMVPIQQGRQAPSIAQLCEQNDSLQTGTPSAQSNSRQNSNRYEGGGLLASQLGLHSPISQRSALPSTQETYGPWLQNLLTQTREESMIHNTNSLSNRPVTRPDSSAHVGPQEAGSGGVFLGPRNSQMVENPATGSMQSHETRARDTNTGRSNSMQEKKRAWVISSSDEESGVEALDRKVKKKAPSVMWNDDQPDGLAAVMLEMIVKKDYIRRILFDQPGDKSTAKPKTYAYKYLAERLFKNHPVYARWYDPNAKHWYEAVRTKLLKLGSKYKLVNEEIKQSGAGLTEEDYANGSSNLYEKHTKDFPLYVKWHDMIGVRASVGTATVNSLDRADPTFSRLANLKNCGMKKKGQKRVAQKAKKKADGGTGSSSEDSHSALSESSKTTDSSHSEDEGTSAVKSKLKQRKTKLDMRNTDNQSARLDSIGSAIQDAADRNTKRKEKRDDELVSLRKGAQALAERKMRFMESHELEKARTMAAVAEKNAERDLLLANLAVANAQRDHEWRMRQAELDAQKIELEKLKLSLLEKDAERNTKTA